MTDEDTTQNADEMIPDNVPEPPCTCKPECPKIGCKGYCGCEKCHQDYADFQSSYGE